MAKRISVVLKRKRRDQKSAYDKSAAPQKNKVSVRDSKAHKFRQANRMN